MLVAKWEPTAVARTQPPNDVVLAFKSAFKEPLDSAKREALNELLKFDLSGVQCAFDEAC
jgi:hypothetical protein